MIASLELWLVILAVGGLNYLSRLSFIALFARWDVPPLMAQALRFVPAAMLAAIVVPAFVQGGGTGPAVDPPRLVAGLVAAIVAWRTRSVSWTIGVGMVVLWGMQWGLRPGT